MEAQQVIEKIMADARAEAEKIKKQAAERQAAEQAALEEQIAQYDAETQEIAQQVGKDEKAHLLAAARMEAAKEYLAEKGKILDEVFSQARQKLERLPEKEYRELMTRLMLDAVETGDEEVIAGARDSHIDRKLVHEINGRVKGQRKGNLTLSDEKHHFGGGFVLKRGQIRTNVSTDVLVQQARAALEIELAKNLFAKDADVSRP